MTYRASIFVDIDADNLTEAQTIAGDLSIFINDPKLFEQPQGYSDPYVGEVEPRAMFY